MGGACTHDRRMHATPFLLFLLQASSGSAMPRSSSSSTVYMADSTDNSCNSSVCGGSMSSSTCGVRKLVAQKPGASYLKHWYRKVAI